MDQVFFGLKTNYAPITFSIPFTRGSFCGEPIMGSSPYKNSYPFRHLELPYLLPILFICGPREFIELFVSTCYGEVSFHVRFPPSCIFLLWIQPRQWLNLPSNILKRKRRCNSGDTRPPLGRYGRVYTGLEMGLLCRMRLRRWRRG
ncbi:uncharacterized protein LOC114749392 [Neltuma alba]|uniref:uncharacterized protein LOC114749392 n=1 Tax=Neltuma alba TaxID=207710 RepID=UPI0010A4812C|nr:uncharacterized protein LOC114749392 [Prosopis alba]